MRFWVKNLIERDSENYDQTTNGLGIQVPRDSRIFPILSFRELTIHFIINPVQ